MQDDIAQMQVSSTGTSKRFDDRQNSKSVECQSLIICLLSELADAPRNYWPAYSANQVSPLIRQPPYRFLPLSQKIHKQATVEVFGYHSKIKSPAKRRPTCAIWPRANPCGSLIHKDGVVNPSVRRPEAAVVQFRWKHALADYRKWRYRFAGWPCHEIHPSAFR